MSHSQVLGVRTPTYEFGGHTIQPITLSGGGPRYGLHWSSPAKTKPRQKTGGRRKKRKGRGRKWGRRQSFGGRVALPLPLQDFRPLVTDRCVAMGIGCRYVWECFTCVSQGDQGPCWPRLWKAPSVSLVLRAEGWGQTLKHHHLRNPAWCS